MRRRLKRVYLLDLKLGNSSGRAIFTYHDGCGKKTWLFFAEVISKFLGNTKDSDYKTIAENMLVCFEALGYRMSLKVLFLHAHLDYFLQNSGDMSEEHGERFYQDIKSMESWHQS